jgi:hypothetical protein
MRKLTAAWSQYTAHDKAMCVLEEKMVGPPSYVGWLTCLDINANARRVDATKSGGNSAPGAGTSSKGSAHSGSGATKIAKALATGQPRVYRVLDACGT